MVQRDLERMKTVAQAGKYYREPFCGEGGVTQGDPLPPTIFNVVVDEVIHHWEFLVAEREGGDSSGEDGDGEQMAGRKIRDKDNRQRRVEEGQQ